MNEPPANNSPAGNWNEHMAQAARYLFDLDFSAPIEPEIEEEIEEIPPEPMITVAEHEALIEQVRAQAYAQGQESARNDREQLASEKTLQTQQALLGEIEMIYTEVGHLLARLERDASKLAFAFASRFAERLVAQEPKVEIQALLNQIMAPLRQTPHISIRLNEAVAEDIKESVDRQMQELGFTGQLTIIPDPMQMPGDCEVEWADGGIGRNLRSAIRQVEGLLEDHFAHVPEDDMPEDEMSEDDMSEDALPDEQVEDEQLENEASDEQQDATPAKDETGQQTEETTAEIQDDNEAPSDPSTENADYQNDASMAQTDEPVSEPMPEIDPQDFATNFQSEQPAPEDEAPAQLMGEGQSDDFSDAKETEL